MIGKKKSDFLTTEEMEDIFIQSDTPKETQKENIIVSLCVNAM